ncbi:MAG: Magnesium chelatase, subunit ChlI [candidate division TM6 bacterium GW2011_GWE2_41_16]|nr:MAG: Magnesium chelatase, subunit ChlI [candidate division TM6 bacterium GW2011_GWE2_41_16]
MHTKIFSAATIGVQAYSVEVEVDLSFGLLNFMIVGLADTAIKESRQRIATALKNCGVKLPERKITINLAPADLKKEGTLFDLPIALGILHASGTLELTEQFIHETIVIGELSLDGAIRSVRGVLPIAADAARLGRKRIIVPKENISEASLIPNIEVIGVSSLLELVAHLRNEQIIQAAPNSYDTVVAHNKSTVDYADVVGQNQAKRTMQIAAAGGHNVLFIGSPGSGKTMLAQRIISILPPMTFNEVLQTSKIYSVCGKLSENNLVTNRPFRAPHHTISQVGLVGGGSFPQPGEISLAHNGILFLDELAEFKKSTLEVLRQPLEERSITVSRAQYSVVFPAHFMLIAALNPCPCGYLGDSRKQCSCTPQQIAKYLDKLSGPFLDRIDLQVSVPSIDFETLTHAHKNAQGNISSAQLYAGVMKARARQDARFGKPGMYNANLSSDMIQSTCVLEHAAEELVKKAFERLHLSMRGYHKLLKVARTIADIEDCDIISVAHLQEAIMYRSLDQTFERRG